MQKKISNESEAKLNTREIMAVFALKIKWLKFVKKVYIEMML